jgi:hypothetical protein
MATKADQYRAQVEQDNSRAKPHLRKVKKHHPGEVMTENGPAKKRGVGHTATRNVSHHAEKKATVALDDSATKPSRKSTRKSANRSKFESSLHIHQINANRSPDFRAAQATARKNASKTRTK